MNYIETGDISGLYDALIEDPDLFTGLDTQVELVALSDDYKYPESYKPVQEILEFKSSGGVELWEMLYNEDVKKIHQWLDEGGDVFIRHPVTGDTIAHINYKIFQALQFHDVTVKEEIAAIENFKGISVEANAISLILGEIN